MMKKIRMQFNRKSYGELLLCLAIALLLTAILEILARRSIMGLFEFLWMNPLEFIYNVYLIFCTLAVSLLFSKRKFYLSVIAAVWLGISITNFFLMLHRSMPLTASDIWLMASVRDIFEKYLGGFVLGILIVGISAVIGCVVLLWLGTKKRGFMLLFSVTHLAALWLGLWGLTSLLTGCGVLAGTTGFSNLPEAYRENGFAYGFAASLVTGGVDEPEDYSENAVSHIVKETERVPATIQNPPNLVFVQLESFFDPTYLKGLTFDEDPIPNFRSLKQSCTTGLLSVPAIGAGTANTEFEVLTGMNLRHFGVGEYPYMTVLGDRPIDSISTALQEIGYSTHAIHNNNATFYDRDVVYENLGFQTYTSLEYMNDVEYTPNGWATDMVLVEEILKTLEITPDRDLTFTVSVQPHGKYPSEPIEGAPIIGVQGVEDEARKNGLEYYLYQLRGCDAFVGALTRELEQWEEPTVVVFYGDHIPSFNFAEDELSYGDTQTTEYVIWANFAMEKADRDLQTYQLAAYVTELCGVHEGLLFRLHQHYACDSEENTAYQDDLQILEYDLLQGERFNADGLTKPASKPMRYDVEDVVVYGAVIDGEDLRVEGENFTPFSVVYINETDYLTEYISSECLLVREITLEEESILYVAQVSAGDSLRILSCSNTIQLE